MPTNTTSPCVLLISIQEDLESLGIKFLHYNLLAHGYPSNLLFLPITRNKDVAVEQVALCGYVRELAPLVVGFSLMSHEYFKVRKLTEGLKESFPDLLVVWGGIHPSISPEMCLSSADLVCVGEGIFPLLELVRALERGDDHRLVPSMAYLKNGVVVKNELHPLPENLDVYPAYEHVVKNGNIFHQGRIVPLTWTIFAEYAPYRGRTYSVITTLGCPYHCAYCCNSFFKDLYGNSRIRRRSYQNVLDELRRAIADHPQITMVNFQDDCFLASSATRLAEFGQAFREQIGRRFIVRAIPTYLTREKLAILREAGLGWIIMGLQSGSDQVNQEIYQRKSTSKHFLKAARLVHEAGVAAAFDVIVDNPFESEEQQLETVAVLMETPKPFFPHFYSLTFYEGTSLRQRALVELGGDLDDPMKKEYHKYRGHVLNALTRLAVFLPSFLMHPLVEGFRTDRHAKSFQVRYQVMRVLSVIMFEPFRYAQLMRLSVRNGSFLHLLGDLPIYLRRVKDLFMVQFQPRVK